MMSRGSRLNAHSEILLSNPLPLGEGKGEGDSAIAGFALTSILSQRERKSDSNGLNVLNNLNAFGLT
jgi:hypothetical protein